MSSGTKFYILRGYTDDELDWQMTANLRREFLFGKKLKHFILDHVPRSSTWWDELIVINENISFEKDAERKDLRRDGSQKVWAFVGEAEELDGGHLNYRITIEPAPKRRQYGSGEEE